MGRVRAVVFRRFAGELAVEQVDDPTPAPDGVVIQVEASGLCRSDWHAWQGHDAGVELPHVPGHEFAGTVVAAGRDVLHWGPGARVTAPFACGCGRCLTCLGGDPHVCPHQTQPGFTHWGSFAELVAVRAADANLVGLPDSLPAAAAALLGCRYATAFRAVTARARVRRGEWVAVYGCGGVGLAAIEIALANGARVIATDPSPAALELATAVGAELAAPALTSAEVAAVSDGGAHVTIDAVGSLAVARSAIAALRPRGRYVQVGLLTPAAGSAQAAAAAVAAQEILAAVVAKEIDVLGSHGMAAHAYPALLALVRSGRLDPSQILTQRVTLTEAGPALATMGSQAGVTIVTPATVSSGRGKG